MVKDERYATMRHGLFPRFVLTGFTFAFAGELLQLLLPVLLPVTGLDLSNYALRDAISLVFFPFAAFALFYLSSRIRVNLGNDYAAVAASIFLGALALLLLCEVPEALQSGQLLWADVASAVAESISYAFVGFAAVLLSYRRRI